MGGSHGLLSNILASSRNSLNPFSQSMNACVYWPVFVLFVSWETFQIILEMDFMCFRNITIPGCLQDRLNLVPMHSLNAAFLPCTVWKTADFYFIWWCSHAHDWSWSNALLGLAWTQFKLKEKKKLLKWMEVSEDHSSNLSIDILHLCKLHWIYT